MNADSLKYCIVGTGGFAQETFCCLLDQLKQKKISPEQKIHFLEQDSNYKKTTLMGGVPVIKQSHFNPHTYHVVVAIGEPNLRKKVVLELPKETNYATIIHPSVVMSKWVDIGKGSIITAGAVLTCNIKLGIHCQLNLHTTIGHDCQVGDYFTTAPGVNISGNCQFEDSVYMGTNSSVKQGISVCSQVTIGMGAAVVKNITVPGVYTGLPAKKR